MELYFIVITPSGSDSDDAAAAILSHARAMADGESELEELQNALGELGLTIESVSQPYASWR